MPPMSKSESLYFIVFAATALVIITVTLWLLGTSSTNCWDNYQTEQQAIEQCEGN